MSIVQVRLMISNSYFIVGDRVVIVDTGMPSEEGKILKALAKAGHSPSDVSLIILTHAHIDHAGSAVALREATGAPIAVHKGDMPYLVTGSPPKLKAANLGGRLLKYVLPYRSPRFDPDQLLQGIERLDRFGVDVKLMPTPGHTPGSISLWVGGEVIVGDLLMGGYLGGKILPGRAHHHYFAEDKAQVNQSVRLLMKGNPKRVYVGHGGPVSPDSIRRYWEFP